MNKRIHYLLVLFFVGMLWASCKKDSVAPVNNSRLPTDTFGYNGINFKGALPFLVYQNSVLTVNISRWVGSETVWGMNFSIHARQTGVYLLSNKDKGEESEHYGAGAWAGWTTDSTHTGQVTLTELDTIHHIASGTFWYNDTIETNSSPYVPRVSQVKNGFFTATW